MAEFKWPKHHLTYRFTPGVGYTPDLPQNTVRKVFQQAFEVNDCAALVVLYVAGILISHVMKTSWQKILFRE